MSEERGMALALPDAATFRRDVQAIREFQKIVHQSFIKDHDYGVIPGIGNKPTLLKPGAEKIAKLLGLADLYEIVDRQEVWDTGFFRFLIRCRLVTVPGGVTISEGLGECNSMESKYRYRWVSERDMPSSIDKSRLVSQERRSKTGGHWTVYRMDNEDVYSQVNTILKMAKKRALVDAALSAGRLSDLFTQDIEDLVREEEATAPEASPAPVGSTPLPVKGVSDSKPQLTVELDTGVDMDWLKESLETLRWHTRDYGAFRDFLRGVLKVSDVTGTLAEMVLRLTPEQKHEMVEELKAWLGKHKPSAVK